MRDVNGELNGFVPPPPYLAPLPLIFPLLLPPPPLLHFLPYAFSTREGRRKRREEGKKKRDEIEKERRKEER